MLSPSRIRAVFTFENGESKRVSLSGDGYGDDMLPVSTEIRHRIRSPGGG
jgi:hypothetical protein